MSFSKVKVRGKRCLQLVGFTAGALSIRYTDWFYSRALHEMCILKSGRMKGNQLHSVNNNGHFECTLIAVVRPRVMVVSSGRPTT